MEHHKITNAELLKLLEERLQQNSVFHQKIDELTDKLYHVNQKLAAAESYKGHFISSITNEIINPFASILLLSKNILQLGDGEIVKAKKMAEMINRESFNLDFQLKNIFAAAMVESGKESLSVREVDMKAVVDNAIRYFSDQIEEKHLQLSVDFSETVPVNFATDANKLDFILKNLLSNAIKYSFASGAINVSVRADKQGIEISVRDFGKGIPEKSREGIFDRFKQVDERINSNNTGHGLGLSIVKSYCHLLDATVQIAFPSDGGTLVEIHFPALLIEDDFDDLSDFVIDPDEKF